MTEEKLPATRFAGFTSINRANYDPHPFTVGPRHIAYAADHNGGILDESVMRRVPCAANIGSFRCNVSYDDHRSDKIGFIKLTRHCTVDEMRKWLSSKKITKFMEDNHLDGVAFVETPEKFRMT